MAEDAPRTNSFFTVAIFRRGRVCFEQDHLQRLLVSAKKIGREKYYGQLQALWRQGPPLDALEACGDYARARAVFFFNDLHEAWQVDWQLSPFEIAPWRIWTVKNIVLEAPRWQLAPGFHKDGEGHHAFDAIFKQAQAEGFDETILWGPSNGETRQWGDSFYSNVGLLMEGQLLFSDSTQWVQSGLGVRRLLANSEISPWPVKMTSIKQSFVQNADALFLHNIARGPRLVELAKTSSQEHAQAQLFYRNWWAQKELL